MESTKEAGCQAPEGPILCIKNCGFFGSAATMNMCSKCHKDMMLEQEQAKSIENIMSRGSTTTTSAIEPVAQPGPLDLNLTPTKTDSSTSSSSQIDEPKPKEGPSRCNTCRKRVGLTGFKCRCGNLFCSVHRYSEKHECPFDYRGTARDAIAKANPVIKADKIEKI